MLDPIIDVLRSILDYFEIYTGNYGIAIILLTLAIRLIMLPLTLKQYQSMKAMQKLQPKMKELQEKYKNNKERLSKEMMNFYKEHKFNPLSGCLPLVLQLPVMYALFQMLMRKDLAEILAQKSFLWINSLTAKDLPLVAIMVATTFYQQLMTATDRQQRNIMLPMTIFMGIIAINLPAGVLIYWVTTNILTIIQQLIQNRVGSEKTVVETKSKSQKNK